MIKVGLLVSFAVILLVSIEFAQFIRRCARIPCRERKGTKESVGRSMCRRSERSERWSQLAPYASREPWQITATRSAGSPRLIRPGCTLIITEGVRKAGSDHNSSKYALPSKLRQVHPGEYPQPCDSPRPWICPFGIQRSQDLPQHIHGFASHLRGGIESVTERSCGGGFPAEQPHERAG